MIVNQAMGSITTEYWSFMSRQRLYESDGMLNLSNMTGLLTLVALPVLFFTKSLQMYELEDMLQQVDHQDDLSLSRQTSSSTEFERIK